MAERADIEHPLPYASWESRGYWEGAGRGEIVLQRNKSTGFTQHKPRGVAIDTLSEDDLEYFVATGRGTEYTFTVTNQNQAPGFAQASPYDHAYDDLDEGPRHLTNIVGSEPEDVSIGMAVVAEFVSQQRDDGEAFAVPVFRPA